MIKILLCAKIGLHFFKEIETKVSTEILNDFEKRFISVVSKALHDVEMSKEPEELNRLRKLFKKNVPLTKRSYVAAYLAKQSINGIEKKEIHSDSNTPKPSPSLQQRKPKVVLNEEEAKSLFLSVGRKRGVGPKDIITLIMHNTELPREHIGEIKILENYCFVQVKKENADEVIASLNTYKFRGRPLCVSYAISKPERNNSTSSQESQNDLQYSNTRTLSEEVDKREV